MIYASLLLSVRERRPRHSSGILHPQLIAPFSVRDRLVYRYSPIPYYLNVFCDSHGDNNIMMQSCGYDSLKRRERPLWTLEDFFAFEKKQRPSFLLSCVRKRQPVIIRGPNVSYPQVCCKFKSPSHPVEVIIQAERLGQAPRPTQMGRQRRDLHAAAY
jgi:hypothetical protein